MLVATVIVALFAAFAGVLLWDNCQPRPRQQGTGHARARRRSF
jgi:hypothetical protein